MARLFVAGRIPARSSEASPMIEHPGSTYDRRFDERDPSDSPDFDDDVFALRVEALQRNKQHVWSAIDWLMDDWRSPRFISPYELALQTAVVAALKATMSKPEREAFDAGATEAEYRQAVLHVAAYHTQSARKALESAA